MIVSCFPNIPLCVSSVDESTFPFLCPSWMGFVPSMLLELEKFWQIPFDTASMFTLY